MPRQEDRGDKLAYAHASVVEGARVARAPPLGVAVEPPYAMRPLFEVTIVVLVVAVAAHFGFQLGVAATPLFWIRVGVPTLVLAAYACLRLARDGELGRLLRPQLGDLSKGFAAAALLYGAAVAFTRVVLPPGTAREAWLVRVYLQIGDPRELRANVALVAIAVLAVSAAEELVWRGLVTRALETRLSASRAWVWTAVLYALAHAPTLWGLRDPRAGHNPLIVAAALGAGLLWGAMTRATRRLPPAIVAHALFDWAVVMVFRLWGAAT